MSGVSTLRSRVKVGWLTAVRYNAKRYASSKESEVVLSETKNCGIITLNRPEVLNSLNVSMIREIYPKLLEWKNSNEISHVLIEGVGEKAFCAGGDIKAATEAVGSDFFREEYYLNYLIGTFHKPYIALLNGITMGGGVGLSVHGSHRVCSEKCVFAMPETAIGFYPDVGGSYFLPRLPGQLGTFLGLTGFRLVGSDVLHAGIATHFIPSSEMLNVRDILVNMESPTRRDVEVVLTDIATPRFKAPPFTLAKQLDLINQHFCFDTVEEIVSSLEKAATNSPPCSKDWFEETLSVLRKSSPTSLKLTLEQIRRSTQENMTLADAFHMENRVSRRRLTLGRDFYEGVRAVLLDKDNKPSWNPKTLHDVSRTLIVDHFAPLPDPRDEWYPPCV